MFEVARSQTALIRQVRSIFRSLPGPAPRLSAVSRGILHPRGHSSNDRPRRDVLRHHGPGPHGRPGADRDPRQDGRVAADRRAVLDRCLDDLPIGGRLQTAVRVGRPRVEVVREHHAVPDEDAVAEADSLADERVARDLAVPPEGRARLDFHKRADFRAVSDSAAVQVHQVGLEDPHVPPELYAVCDHVYSPYLKPYFPMQRTRSIDEWRMFFQLAPIALPPFRVRKTMGTNPTRRPSRCARIMRSASKNTLREISGNSNARFTPSLTLPASWTGAPNSTWGRRLNMREMTRRAGV